MDTEELGEFRFRMRKSPWRLAVWAVLVLSVPLAMFVAAANGRFADVTGNEIIISLLLVLALIILVADFATVCIDVHTEAMVYRRLLGRKVVRFSPYMHLYVRRWRYGFLMFRFGRFSDVHFEDESGHSHHIRSSFHRNEQLAAVIEHYLFRNSMHMLNQIYDAGEVLNFGAIQLSRQHIGTAERAVLCEQVGRYAIGGGKLKIYGGRKNAKLKLLPLVSVPVEKIANFRILCRFIDLNDVGMIRHAYRTKRIWFI